MSGAERPTASVVDVVILLYDGVGTVEALGPHAVLRRLPGARVRFVSEEPGPQLGHDPAVTLLADFHLSHATSPDIVVVPGGFGEPRLVEDSELLRWLRQVHPTSRWTMASSTGSVLLAAAGLLRGQEATTHWLAHDLLRSHGARPVSRRVVEQGKVITCIGASAALEMALVVAEREAGPEVAARIRRELESDLDAPFTVGKPPSHAAITRWWEDAGGAGDEDTGPWWRRWWRRARRPKRVIIGG
jgi:transcriptional regulator GlxA family with amidase domain